MRTSRVEGTTPFPNPLLDHAMKFLGDTEWRVLCVVVRQTLGWQKREDWLSHSQLKARTGREGAAVSRAVECLVHRGLIVVTDSHGRLLQSASERRRSRSRLTYALHPLLLDSARYRRKVGLSDFRSRSSESENDKSNLNLKKETADDV